MKPEACFDDLVKAIQDAFIKVNDMAEQQHLQMLGKYFDEDGKAKTFPINYDTTDEHGQIQSNRMEIPALCMLPISSLKLDEVEVDFKVRLYGEVKMNTEGANEEKIVLGSIKQPENNTLLSYLPLGNKGKDDDYASIRLKFVSDEPPEGLMRIQDLYTKISM